MNRIFKEMTVINSLFILMNSQSDWLLRSISSDKILMGKILSSQEFKDFMNDSSTPLRLKADASTQNKVEKVIENNPELIEKMNELDELDAKTDRDSDSDSIDYNTSDYNSEYNSSYGQTIPMKQNNPYENLPSSSSSSYTNNPCVIS
jgi:hypothetical protein